jgi:hypothetical protein
LVFPCFCLDYSSQLHLFPQNLYHSSAYLETIFLLF